jgi:hypothetical protein
MNKLKLFVEENYERFSNLEESEVCELDAHYIDDDIVNYLKDIRYGYGTNPKFTHNGIAVYYVGDSDEVWVENMDAEEEKES